MAEKRLYEELCTYDNIQLAFTKSRRGKTLKSYVIKFEEDLINNLRQLQHELITQTYKPMPLVTFILRDPKTRKISKSDFRDRIVHHAICNVIEPIFDKTFIYDNYANRIGKGTFSAIERFDQFKRKVLSNDKKACYVLKADVKHYFETVDHNILMSILERKIEDNKLLNLIKIIISNHNTSEPEKGMPLGNLTSQFFANVYLNELDQFVKHKLRAKYYIRYVDDFVIFHSDSKALEDYKTRIDKFLKHRLELCLHPDKSKIIKLKTGVGFLGFRIFFSHKLVRKKNLLKFEKKFNEMREEYKEDIIPREKVLERFEGWLAYVQHANTYKYRKHLVREFNKHFPIQKPVKITDVKKHENFIYKSERSQINFSPLKTQELFRKGLSVEQIAKQRGIKIGTVWEHFATLIEHNQLSLWKILPKEKINKILPQIFSPLDKLKTIKERINEDNVSYDEINCCLAYVKFKNKKRNIVQLCSWYQKIYCFRKCYLLKDQRKACKMKFDKVCSYNPNLEMTKKEFINFFYTHLSICILPEKEKMTYIPWKKFKQSFTGQFRTNPGKNKNLKKGWFFSLKNDNH
ncbi:MAG: reverse transcriptase domain-containing protein [Candidatus Woesearchaeota archaeon]